MAPLPAGRDKIPAYDTLFTSDTLPEEYDAQYEKTYHKGPELLSTSKRGLNQLSHESLSNWAYNQLGGPYDNRPPPPGQPPDYWKHHRPAVIYTPDPPPTHPPARQPPSSYDPGYPENPGYGRDYTQPRPAPHYDPGHGRDNLPPRPVPPYDPGHGRDNLPARPAPHYDPGYNRDNLPPRPATPYDPGHPPAQQMPSVHDPHVDQTPGHVPPKPAAPSLAEKAGGVHNMVYIGGVIGAVVIIAGAVLIFKTWMEKRDEKKEAEGGGDGGGGVN